MVDDDVGDRVSPQGVVADLEVAAAEPQVADDDVVGVDVDALAPDADAVAGGGLAGEGEERVLDVQRAFERDQAGDAEDDDARALGLDGGPEAARAPSRPGW